MSLNATPSANRTHIAFFGRRNAGKSSVVNAVTGQQLSIVSEVRGTTTDPVQKAMELLPLGPVVIIDTPGIDDEGALGAQRVARTRRVLNKADIAVLVIDAAQGLTPVDQELTDLFRTRDLPYLLVYNKSDLACPEDLPENALAVSALHGEGIHELKERLAHLANTGKKEKPLVADLLSPGDTVVLVVPIDSAAPKGRLILPQQQVIRDALEADALPMICRESELAAALDKLIQPPCMVITDSQAFREVAAIVPPEIPLTSFSILMARYKGNLRTAVAGVAALNSLQNGDPVLISEGCTHHRQCDDIGMVKLPRWIRAYTGAEPVFSWTTGTEFPEDVSGYRMVIHCGGCMLNEREMQYRFRSALSQGVPITNYGTAIARLTGILPRSLQLFPDAAALLPQQNE
ncbi:MAG: [FeFe] hydrogenase H-cluster maturation GTPase HydF [Lachnospiraceae bacterium]|nr:[FeFe] hydrogenase H-cluster maturation GTPase HydF [Lachnospiraceae bacterium]